MQDGFLLIPSDGKKLYFGLIASTMDVQMECLPLISMQAAASPYIWLMSKGIVLQLQVGKHGHNTLSTSMLVAENTGSESFSIVLALVHICASTCTKINLTATVLMNHSRPSIPIPADVNVPAAARIANYLNDGTKRPATVNVLSQEIARLVNTGTRDSASASVYPDVVAVLTADKQNDPTSQLFIHNSPIITTKNISIPYKLKYIFT